MACDRVRRKSDAIPDIEADVVVVGAGMAGLYSSWRLLRSDPGLRIHLVERLDRTGGRLQTDHFMIDGVEVRTEEGGMRFLESQQELYRLIGELGLTDQVVPFPMGDDNNCFYLRGKRFTVGHAKKNPSVWSSLYDLNETAKNKQPGEILKDVLYKILDLNGVNARDWNPTASDWTRLRMEFEYHGVPLYEWGFWALLDDFGLSQDCIQMLYESSGFIAPYDQQVNAGCAFQLLDDFIGTQFHALKEGYSQLPDALEADVRKHGGTFHLGHMVRGIDRLEDGRLLVTARAASGDTTTLAGRSVILGLTQIALRELVPHVPLFRESDTFRQDIESVTDMALSKINMYYEHSWWTEALGIQNGGSFTDLPLAQFYCFSRRGADYDGPASITVYTDYIRSNFWAELQNIGEPYSSEMFPENPPGTVAATTFVVKAAMRQMKLMFGLNDIPAPVLTTYKRWMDPAMGDGDHQWRVGIDDRQVRSRMIAPFPGLHVCGESYSDEQTWVNGALRSVDEMLAEHFSLPAS